MSIYISATTAWRSGALCASGLGFPTGDSRQPFYANCSQSMTGALYISFVRWVPASAVVNSGSDTADPCGGADAAAR